MASGDNLSDIAFCLRKAKIQYKIVSIKQQLKHGDVLTVCSYHVTYTFQSESRFYSCLNVKELLARDRHEI